MKTIAQYFTSPKFNSELSTKQSLNGNKSQTSIKILFEKSSCGENKRSKPAVKYDDESKSSKKNHCRKKLKFLEIKANGSAEGDSLLDEPESRETVTRKSKNYNGNSVNMELGVKNDKSNFTPNCKKEPSNKASVKSVKRKAVVEEVSSLKKKKWENADMNTTNKKSVVVGAENSESVVEDKNVASPLISQKANERKISSSKRKKKNSMKCKLSKKTVENSVDSETPQAVKKILVDEVNEEGIGEKSNLQSKSKKNILMEPVKVITVSDLDVSLEIFEVKEMNKKNIANKDCKQEVLNQNVSKVSPPEKSQHKSLFSYFNKVDKESALVPKQYSQIKVQALVHSPPKKEPKTSSRKSLDRIPLSGKRSGVKSKALLKASDKIDVLSSEVMELPDETVHEVVNDLIVNDEKKTPNNKKTGLESYFKVSNVQKTPDVNDQNSPRAVPKSWTMRVRLTPQTSEPILIDEDSNVSGSSLSHPEFSRQPVVVDDDSCTAEKSSSPVKMYSLFTREEKLPKPAVDLDRLAAKARFLESGAPESVKRKVDFLKSENSVGIPAQFPSVSHVQQQDTVIDAHDIHNIPYLHLVPPLTNWNPAPVSEFPLSSDVCAVSTPATTLGPPKNIKAYLQELKNQEPNVPVNAVYKSLRKKRKKCGNSSELWTEVYKPEVVSEIVGNTENVKKLKTWLQVQKNIRRREGSESSGDEFVNSDSDGEDKPRTNNMAILAGPYGSGKTCTVYAVAKELGCEVLEINSSCNRTGKRLLTEFSESTQSHNVDLSQSMAALFNPSSSVKKKKNSRSDSSDTTPSGKTSLLLVEDADILFANHDEGFVSAIATLISTTKRPVILTINDPKCIHLSKFESVNQLQLTFNRPRTSKLVLWLRIVALVEGIELSTQLSQRLVEWSKGDVRRSLLQLQLMVQSKMSQANEERSLVFLWWNWPATYDMQFQLPTLLENDEVEESQEKLDKEKVKSDLKSIAKLTENLARMDTLSSLHHRIWLDNPCPKPWHAIQVDATNLSEQDILYELKDTISSELSDWLAKTVIRESEKDLQSRFCRSSEKRWCNLLRKANDLYLPAVSLSQHCCRYAVTSDYLPALRTLGRAEKLRLTTYTKRANRYFSYLKGLGIHANKNFKDFMCDSFSQDCL